MNETFASAANTPQSLTQGCVDVIITAWNREATIGKAIQSALADPAVGRVLVIDDASHDRTAERAEACAGGSPRVVVKRLPANAGPSGARNLALRESQAPWIAVLDADDYLLPGRISRMLAWAQDWDFIADDILQIPEGSAGSAEPVPLLSAQAFAPWPCDFKAFVNGNISRPGRLRKELGFFKPLMRREFLGRHNLHYDESLRLGEDYALYAKALALGARLLVVPAQGYVSVIRPDSLSARHSKQDLERLRDSDRELAKVREFAPDEAAAIGKHMRSIDARVQWLNVIEAVKRRRFAAIFAAFLRSWDVSAFITARLWEQLLHRGAAYFLPARRRAIPSTKML